LLKTGELPKAQQQLKKAKNALTQAEKTYEKVRFSLAYSFEQYVQNRENALDNVDYAKQGVANAEQSIKELEFQVATYEAILEDLS
jgi:outer membrane protein TolC